MSCKRQKGSYTKLIAREQLAQGISARGGRLRRLLLVGLDGCLRPGGESTHGSLRERVAGCGLIALSLCGRPMRTLISMGPLLIWTRVALRI
jgi:hypothetical protein